MKCPLKFNTMDKDGVQCEMAECAWWDEDGRRCAIYSLARDLFRIAETVAVNAQPYEDYNPWREHGSHEPLAK